MRRGERRTKGGGAGRREEEGGEGRKGDGWTLDTVI